jgi:hypothetical protein
MKRIAMLLMPAVLLAAATAPAPRDSRAPETPGSQHMNRHVDAHMPAGDGNAGTKDPEEPARRRQAQDPFRGVVQPQTPLPPAATQPLRDRRY